MAQGEGAHFGAKNLKNQLEYILYSKQHDI